MPDTTVLIKGVEILLPELHIFMAELELDATMSKIHTFSAEVTKVIDEYNEGKLVGGGLVVKRI